MNVQVILWILGIAVMALTGVIGFLVNWNRGQDERMGKIEDKVSTNARHTAENYVRGHEIAEVKKAVADLRMETTASISELRTEMSAAVGNLRTEVSHQIGELTKAVYQMMGQNNSK